jgi:two-component system, NarL family, nitrate/nitrite response regulator NarL
MSSNPTPAPPIQPAGRTRIVIADGHPIFRDGLRKVLEGNPEFSVIGEAGDGEEAVRLAQKLIPDVLLLNLDLPRRSGLNVLRDLSARGSTVRVVVLAAAGEKPDILQALRLGARGVVPKESNSQALCRGLRCVIGGRFWVVDQGFDNLAKALRSLVPVEPGLTPRELEVLGAIARGSTNKDIAQQLSLSDETVRHHVANLFEKLGVSNRVEAALYAVKNHLVE